jgi:Uma2 family endonuclease
MHEETTFRSDERFTQEGFRAWLERRPASDVNRYELIRGCIVMSPPARWRHGHVGARLNFFLVRLAAEAGLGPVFDGTTGYELDSGDTVEPDVSFVSAARWRSLPQPVPDGFLRITPDLIVEVLSRSTASRDFNEKKQIYAENGVREYWIVDPDRRRVTIFLREVATFDAGRVVESGPLQSQIFPSPELTVEALFGDLLA